MGSKNGEDYQSDASLFCSIPTTCLSTRQKKSLEERPALGPVWVSRVSFPPPEDALRQALFGAIKSLDRNGWETFTLPSLDPVEAEWTGYRGALIPNAPNPP